MAASPVVGIASLDWTAKLAAPPMASQSLFPLVRRVTSNQQLPEPAEPSLTLPQQLLSTQLVFMSNITMSYLGLC